MNEQHGSDITVERQSDFDPMRRDLLKMAGVGVAALNITAIADTPAAASLVKQAQSQGVKVSVRKVAFKNQYQLNGVPAAHHAPDPDHQRQVHELLPAQ
jgi:hypothetical protein